MPLPGLPDVSDERLFTLCNGVLPAWVLLAIAPRWRWTSRIALLVAAAYAAFYAALLINAAAGGGGAAPLDANDFFDWQGVARLLAKPSSVLIAWVHYVAFDLFVGRWEAIDAGARGVPQLLMAPVLFLTLMFGPCGLLLYLAAVRPWFRSRTTTGASGKRD